VRTTIIIMTKRSKCCSEGGRLISVSQLANDQKKSLYYDTKILKIAKKENKLNEFVCVHVRDEIISKLLVEFGEYLLAERCVSVVCMLHFGTSLVSVEFELDIDITKLEFTELPQGIELPKILTPLNSLPTPNSSSSQSTSSGGTWNLSSHWWRSKQSFISKLYSSL
jgi:hypothetical protein